MEIIPAIDLRNGAVVRLLQGDYDRQTTFDDDPVRVAMQFAADAAPRIHLVDLDGAREGRRTQAAEVRAIAAAVGVPVQLGGGLRSADDISSALADGVDRIVFGTAAVEEPALVEQALANHGAERIIVGIDAREGMVSVSGWTAGSEVAATELLSRMADAGVRRFVYTDITRDGTLTSPNFPAVEEMAARAASRQQRSQHHRLWRHRRDRSPPHACQPRRRGGHRRLRHLSRHAGPRRRHRRTGLRPLSALSGRGRKITVSTQAAKG